MNIADLVPLFCESPEHVRHQLVKQRSYHGWEVSMRTLVDQRLDKSADDSAKTEVGNVRETLTQFLKFD